MLPTVLPESQPHSEPLLTPMSAAERPRASRMMPGTSMWEGC